LDLSNETRRKQKCEIVLCLQIETTSVGEAEEGRCKTEEKCSEIVERVEEMRLEEKESDDEEQLRAIRGGRREERDKTNEAEKC